MTHFPPNSSFRTHMERYVKIIFNAVKSSWVIVSLVLSELQIKHVLHWRAWMEETSGVFMPRVLIISPVPHLISMAASPKIEGTCSPFSVSHLVSQLSRICLASCFALMSGVPDWSSRLPIVYDVDGSHSHRHGQLNSGFRKDAKHCSTSVFVFFYSVYWTILFQSEKYRNRVFYITFMSNSPILNRLKSRSRLKPRFMTSSWGSNECWKCFTARPQNFFLLNRVHGSSASSPKNSDSDILVSPTKFRRKMEMRERVCRFLIQKYNFLIQNRRFEHDVQLR